MKLIGTNDIIAIKTNLKTGGKKVEVGNRKNKLIINPGDELYTKPASILFRIDNQNNFISKFEFMICSYLVRVEEVRKQNMINQIKLFLKNNRDNLDIDWNLNIKISLDGIVYWINEYSLESKSNYVANKNRFKIKKRRWWEVFINLKWGR